MQQPRDPQQNPQTDPAMDQNDDMSDGTPQNRNEPRQGQKSTERDPMDSGGRRSGGADSGGSQDDNSSPSRKDQGT